MAARARCLIAVSCAACEGRALITGPGPDQCAAAQGGVGHEADLGPQAHHLGGVNVDAHDLQVLGNQRQRKYCSSSRLPMPISRSQRAQYSQAATADKP